MVKTVAKRRKVKSQPKKRPVTVDEHEKGHNFLTLDEFEKLLVGARLGRHAARDTAMLYLLLQHGYRASELCRTKRDDFDSRRARLMGATLEGLVVDRSTDYWQCAARFENLFAIAH